MHYLTVLNYLSILMGQPSHLQNCSQLFLYSKSQTMYLSAISMEKSDILYSYNQKRDMAFWQIQQNQYERMDWSHIEVFITPSLFFQIQNDFRKLRNYQIKFKMSITLYKEVESGFVLAPEKPVLTQQQRETLRALIEQSPSAVSDLLSCFTKIRVSQPVCINLVFHGKPLATITPVVSPLFVSNEHHEAVFFPLLEENDQIRLHIGDFRGIKQFEIDAKEKRVKCQVASEIGFNKGKRVVQIRESAISYILKTREALGTEEIIVQTFYSRNGVSLKVLLIIFHLYNLGQGSQRQYLIAAVVRRDPLPHGLAPKHRAELERLFDWNLCCVDKEVPWQSQMASQRPNPHLPLIKTKESRVINHKPQLIYGQSQLYLRILTQDAGKPIMYQDVTINDYSIKNPHQTIIVDAQFDNLRELSIWCLLYIQSVNLFTMQLIEAGLNGSPSQLKEEHILSPSLLEKTSFEPTSFHHYFNVSLNNESLYLLSHSKLLLLSRTGQIEGVQQKFTHIMIVDFLDPLGLMRRANLLDQFCSLEDDNLLPIKVRQQNKVNTVLGDETGIVEMTENGAINPLIRAVPFDIDDDIVVLPDFINRKANCLKIVLAWKIVEYAEQTQKQNSETHIECHAEIIEEGASVEECQINQALIFHQGRSQNGKLKRFTQEHEKLILVATLKSFSLWGYSSKDKSQQTTKLCNIQPFTQLTYLNKLQIAKCAFKQGKSQQESANTKFDVICFTQLSKLFMVEVTL